MDPQILAKIKAVKLFTTMSVPVEWLLAPNYNPRSHKEENLEALKLSIKEDPDFFRVRPVVINTYPGREGIVIGGSKRLLAAQELEMARVPGIFVYVDPTKEKAWNLKDNVPTGEWIEEKRKEVLMDLRNDGYDLSSIGFGGGEIVDMMGGVQLTGNHSEPDNANGTTPKQKPKVKIKEGDELECPKCHHLFSYGVATEDVDEDDEE